MKHTGANFNALCIHTLMVILYMPFSFRPFCKFVFVEICRDWICYFCMTDTLVSSKCFVCFFICLAIVSIILVSFLCNIHCHAPEK